MAPIKDPNKAPQSREEELLRYLKEQPLWDQLPLVSNKSLTFHWANWTESCAFQKNYLFDNARSCERYFDLDQKLEQLKQTAVWMKNRQKTIQSTMYDLYQCYADSRIRSTWFEREDEILLSLERESGPYITLSSMRWMDKDVYSQFVYKKILTQHMPLRGFRLGSQIPVGVSFEGASYRQTQWWIHQISEHGLLFKIQGQHQVNLLDQSEKILLEVNLRPFLETANASINDTLKRFERQDFSIVNPEYDKLTVLALDPKILDKYNNRWNFRLSAQDEFYLFVKYRDLTNQSNSIRLKKIFKSLVTKFEHQFNEVLKQSA